MTYLNIYYSLYIFAITFLVSVTDSHVMEECKTPTGKGGHCVKILNCHPIVEFIKKSVPLTPDVMEELKQYQCGYQDGYPKVCCSVSVDMLSIANHRNINLLSRDCGPVGLGRMLTSPYADLFEFPWMALISYKYDNKTEFKCGGTIINDRYILTAAHCLQSKYHIAGVRVGEFNLKTDIDCLEGADITFCSPPYQDLSIEEVITHPAYDNKMNANDIGLIRVQKVVFKDNIQSICLPLNPSPVTNFIDNSKRVALSGWGLAENITASSKLLLIYAQIVPLGECNATYGQAAMITDKKHICVTSRHFGEHCVSDIGGPLQIVEYLNNYVRYVQYGVMSIGPNKCLDASKPRVFTNVIFYMQWILDSLKP